jgi:antirestriction protein ArdC
MRTLNNHLQQLFETIQSKQGEEIKMNEPVPKNQELSTNKRFDIYQQVTDTIIKQLEAGTIPWQQSWVNSQSGLSLPKNAVTGNNYRGINIVLLWSAALDKKFPSNEWASFKQWQSKNENIRKSEKGNFVVYADTFEKEIDNETKKIPFLKYSIVFNRSQLANFKPEDFESAIAENKVVDKIELIEDFVANTFANIGNREGGACYIPALDKILMPPMNSFLDTKSCSASENYYSTLFHEMTHWTGHEKRLNRSLKGRFGDHAYAEEELIAELGAAFLGAEFNISSPEKTDHASYIANWLKVLKDNKKFVISAASEASKAVDFVNEIQPLKITL